MTNDDWRKIVDEYHIKWKETLPNTMSKEEHGYSLKESHRQFEDDLKPLYEFQISKGINPPLRFYSMTKEAAPVFLEALEKNAWLDDSIKIHCLMSLGAAFSNKEMDTDLYKNYFNRILALYVSEPDKVQSAIGCPKDYLAGLITGLYAHNKDKKLFEKIFELASDERNGSSRLHFFLFLRRFKDERIHVLIRNTALYSDLKTNNKFLRRILFNGQWKEYWKKRDPELYNIYHLKEDTY